MRFIFLLVLILLSAQSYGAKIMIIGSYHQDYPWELDYNRGIRDTLGDNHSYYNFHMDTKRLKPEAYKERADQAWKLYQSVNPDLVFLGDDNAVKYLNQRFRKTSTPVVFLGINSDARTYKTNNAENFTGVYERPLLKRSIVLAQQLMGKRNNVKVLVLFDSGTTSIVSAEHLSEKKQHMTIGNTEIDIKNIGNYESWQKTILAAKEKGYNTIFIGLYQTIYDAEGRHIPAADVLAWTRRYSPVPHFGFWSFSVGLEGNIGGYVLDGYVHGVNAAGLARKILGGAAPNSLYPKIDSTGRYLLSRSGIKKWQLQIPDNVLSRAIWVD